MIAINILKLYMLIILKFEHTSTLTMHLPRYFKPQALEFIVPSTPQGTLNVSHCIMQMDMQGVVNSMPTQSFNYDLEFNIGHYGIRMNEVGMQYIETDNIWYHRP